MKSYITITFLLLSLLGVTHSLVPAIAKVSRRRRRHLAPKSTAPTLTPTTLAPTTSKNPTVSPAPSLSSEPSAPTISPAPSLSAAPTKLLGGSNQSNSGNHVSPTKSLRYVTAFGSVVAAIAYFVM